ncbi:uncharacterized protein RSE6_06152 [Rhynchosporium secalis]|uniref:Uncharacterized protein n=1 Tax=Rhynchosporium secalis TaxID=38038 RepID=A0A1E1M9N2_RHYSE|nr:uncharacterized protein RSE6_06152 [Rhynchosporium secalis]
MSSAAIDGVWDVDPSQTLILMTDLKTAGPSTLQAVQQQLAPFRERVPPIATSSSTHHFTISLQYMTLQTPTTPAHLSGGKDKISISGLSKAQMIVVKQQIDEAARLGLVSRYWDVPSWAVNLRMAVWRQLEEVGVGILNVDEIDEAARWN